VINMSITPADSGLSDLINSLEMVSTKYLPNTVKAIKVACTALQYTWKSYAMGAPIPGTNIKIKNVKGAYAKSIKTQSGKLSGTVYSDSPYAVSIEDDSEAFDLKKTIPFGKNARMGKNGAYNIVPFRHGVPGSLSAPMPDAIYRMITEKIRQGEIEKSKIRKKTYMSPNAAGEMVKRHTYKWGGALKKTGFPNFEGMVVFDISSSGKENRGGYLTFRIITANKPKVSKSQKGWENSWIVPSRRGYHLTRYVVANTKDIVANIIKAGIQFDMMP
jgi:hypothetical protein